MRIAQVRAPGGGRARDDRLCRSRPAPARPTKAGPAVRSARIYSVAICRNVLQQCPIGGAGAATARETAAVAATPRSHRRSGTRPSFRFDALQRLALAAPPLGLNSLKASAVRPSPKAGLLGTRAAAAAIPNVARAMQFQQRLRCSGGGGGGNQNQRRGETRGPGEADWRYAAALRCAPRAFVP